MANKNFPALERAIEFYEFYAKFSVDVEAESRKQVRAELENMRELLAATQVWILPEPQPNCSCASCRVAKAIAACQPNSRRSVK